MARRKRIQDVLKNAMGQNTVSSATTLRRTRNKQTGRIEYQRNSTSARGRMSEYGSTRAGGTTQTLGDGRGGGQATRRQRYYDIRKGLGLAGG